jgi:hypothetical protein
MDSVMGMDSVGDLVAVRKCAVGSPGSISAVPAELSAAALRVSTFPQRAATSAALGGISAVVVASHPAWVTRFYDYECSYPYYNPNSCSPSVY